MKAWVYIRSFVVKAWALIWDFVVKAWVLIWGFVMKAWVLILGFVMKARVLFVCQIVISTSKIVFHTYWRQVCEKTLKKSVKNILLIKTSVENSINQLRFGCHPCGALRAKKSAPAACH